MIDRQYTADKLSELRQKKGLTQAEAAKAIGVSLSAYNQYESGEKTPRDDIKLNIASLYDRSVQFLFFKKNTH